MIVTLAVLLVVVDPVFLAVSTVPLMTKSIVETGRIELPEAKEPNPIGVYPSIGAIPKFAAEIVDAELDVFGVYVQE